MRLRVVCGLGETMATFRPTSVFTRVDLPAFGRPTIAMNPDLNATAIFYAKLRGIFGLTSWMQRFRRSGFGSFRVFRQRLLLGRKARGDFRMHSRDQIAKRGS